MSSPLPAVEKSAARGGGGRATRAQRQGTGACGPGPLALVWGSRGRKGPPGPQTPPPPGPRFFYGADDAILEESPGAAGDSVQGG